jgi:hypothetical protein
MKRGPVCWPPICAPSFSGSSAANESLRAAQSAWGPRARRGRAVRTELAEARKLAIAEIDAVNKRTDAASGELAKAHARAEAQAEQMTRAQVERDEARKLAAEAREAGAKLAGQLEATQAQNAALLAALKTDGTAGDDKPPRGGKGTRK